MAQAAKMYFYEIGWRQPQSQSYEIQLKVQKSNGRYTVFRLPIWRPGRYILQHYAAAIWNFQAQDEEGNPLPWRKIEKSAWQVQNPKKGTFIIIRYRFYANRLDAGSSYLSPELAYMNPVNFLMSVDKHYNLPCELLLKDLNPDWKVATALRKKAFNHFVADSYHELVDNPIVCAPSLVQLQFETLGKRFYLHFWGNYQLNHEAEQTLIKNVRRIVEEQTAIFGELPVEEYHFIYLLVPFYLRHAVEHSRCAVFVLPEQVASSKSALYGLYGITSHEFWHLWNVKRIRPQALLPYDYAEEPYTSLHWFTEGVTDYYAYLILVRAGIMTPTDFFRNLSETWTALENHAANYYVSPAQASMDSWLVTSLYLYKPLYISYYPLGKRLGFLLDLLLRVRTNNAVSLDEVFRYLYEHYYKKNKGIEEDELQEICEKLSGTSLEFFFQNFVWRSGPYPFETLIEELPLKIEVDTSYENDLSVFGVSEVSVVKATKQKTQWLVVEDILPEGDILQAGVAPGDMLLKLGPYNLQNVSEENPLPSNWYETIKVGATIPVTYLRNNELLHGSFTFSGRFLPKKYRIIAEDHPVFQSLFASAIKEKVE